MNCELKPLHTCECEYMCLSVCTPALVDWKPVPLLLWMDGYVVLFSSWMNNMYRQTDTLWNAVTSGALILLGLDAGVWTIRGYPILTYPDGRWELLTCNHRSQKLNCGRHVVLAGHDIDVDPRRSDHRMTTTGRLAWYKNKRYQQCAAPASRNLKVTTEHYMVHSKSRIQLHAGNKGEHLNQ